MNQETGYTLIEVIASLVIVGIIATFSSMFLVYGLEGYEFTRKAADAAMKAEVALNRISLELKSIITIPSAPVTNTSITYTSSNDTLTGARTIKFNSGSIYINVDGTDYKLIDDVSSPVLSVALADLDDDGTEDEVAYIDVGFSLSDMPAFSVRIYPRDMVSTETW